MAVVHVLDVAREIDRGQAEQFIPMLLGGEADEAHLEAGGLSAGCAAREKTIGGASCAWADACDICGGESCAFELVADNGAQVDEGLAGTPCPRMISRAVNLAIEALA